MGRAVSRILSELHWRPGEENSNSRALCKPTVTFYTIKLLKLCYLCMNYYYFRTAMKRVFI